MVYSDEDVPSKFVVHLVLNVETGEAAGGER